MTIQVAYKQLLAALYQVYEDREAANIANWVMEHVTGQDKLTRLMYKDLPVLVEQQQQLEVFTGELLKHKPVQYVLNECWFAGMKFYVDENVLIPRPETEELVEWIVSDWKENVSVSNEPMHFMDIGTGSGCIPIALKKQLPAIKMSAIEVSLKALSVARRNAREQGLDVQFIEMDFLNPSSLPVSGKIDLIVSNPPYIKQSEAATMAANVLQFEPSQALFVPDNNALVFYEAIANYAAGYLHKKGAVYVEINEALGNQVCDLFAAAGFKNVTLRKDMQGKDRMVRAGRS